MNGDLLLEFQRAGHHVGDFVARELDSLGLSLAEANVLANLLAAEAPKVSTLVGLTGYKATALTALLDRLETRSLVERRPNPRDRRAVAVRLTPQGRRAASAVRRELARLEQRVRRQVPATAIDSFMQVVHALGAAGPSRREVF
jgi:MarR family transcriptional regulator, organic hydroperoxide resistance regulator